MKSITEQLEAPARAMGVPVSELAAITQRGELVSYEGGACLFHESTPRQWLGMVLEGELEVVRGSHGRRTQLATLTSGALVAEGVLLDECAHSASAFARAGGAKVLQVSGCCPMKGAIRVAVRPGGGAPIAPNGGTGGLAAASHFPNLPSDPKLAHCG